MNLKEQIARQAIIASVFGFAGVLVILAAQAEARLGPEALQGSLAILCSATLYAWNIILMRQQAQIAGLAEIAFFQNIIVTAILLLGAPFLFEVPALHHFPAILLAAVLATTSLFLLSWGYARGEASYLAATEYTSFLWATLLGYLVFGELVSPFTVAGAALIVGGCLWAARQRPPAAVADVEAAL